MAQSRQIAAPAYLVAFSLVLIPQLDALMQVLPFRLQDPRWRFGFFGLFSNALMLPLCGLLVAFAVADALEHRRFQRILGILSIALAVVLFLLIAMFALDVLQVRRDIKPTAKLAFTVASITAMGKAGLGLLTLGAFGLAGLKGPKVAKAVPAKRGGALLVGAKAPVAGAAAPAAVPVVTESAGSAE